MGEGGGGQGIRVRTESNRSWNTEKGRPVVVEGGRHTEGFHSQNWMSNTVDRISWLLIHGWPIDCQSWPRVIAISAIPF